MSDEDRNTLPYTGTVGQPEVSYCQLDETELWSTEDLRNHANKLVMKLQKENKQLKKISKKILEGESERNIKERKKLGLKEGAHRLDGNFKINQAMYEMDSYLKQLETEGK